MVCAVQSVVCAAQYVDCTNPYFAPNIYTYNLQVSKYIHVEFCDVFYVHIYVYMCTYLQVNANGIIFINSSSGVSSPTNFAMLPQGSTPFIAPYWFDNDPSSHGNVSYEIHPKSSPLLTQVSEYISNRESVQFTGNWMMVAYWLDVPELFSEDVVRNTVNPIFAVILIL